MMKLASLFAAILITHSAHAENSNIFECDAEIVGAATPAFSLRVSTDDNSGLTAKINAAPLLTEGEHESVPGSDLSSDSYTFKSYVDFITKHTHRSPSEVASGEVYAWERPDTVEGEVSALIVLALHDQNGKVVGIGGSFVKGETDVQSWVCR